jgi:RNA polymerase sigma-70 factor, ECF subfamily
MLSTKEESKAALDVYSQARELALLQRIAARDRAAMSELYFNYHHRLANFFSCLTSRPGLVEQMTVDTLVDVWQRAGSFDRALRVSTWIIAMAYRRALRSWADHDAAFEEGRRAQVRGKLGRALLILPMGQRALLALTYCLGCSCKEVASILECSTGQVGTQLLLARQMLRAALSG